MKTCREMGSILQKAPALTRTFVGDRPSKEPFRWGISMRRKASVTTNVLKGAIAGAVATWTLDLVTTYMYEREAQPERQREDQARRGRSAYESAAEKVGRILGCELSEDGRQRLGVAIHWLLGMGAGVFYGAVGRKIPAFRRAGGGAFGTAFWAAVDEGLNPFLGLTPPPKAFPWQTHARGLAGHLAYGVAAEQTLKALDAVI
jgi:hypothetical protein